MKHEIPELIPNLQQLTDLKKALPILLIGVFLFNLAGYRLAFHLANRQADKTIQVKLDKGEYNEQELVVLKVPMAVPYYSGTTGFEYTRGEVTLNGTIYRYVKKRVVNDTVEMYCIPHTSKMELAMARDRFAQLASDYVNTPGKTQKNPVKVNIKPFFSDWCENTLETGYISRAPETIYAHIPEAPTCHPYTGNNSKPPEYRLLFS